MEAVIGIFGLLIMAAVLVWVMPAKVYGTLQALLAVGSAVCGAWIGKLVIDGGVVTSYGQMFYIDGLGAINVLLVTTVGALAAIYSKGYMEEELAEGAITKMQFKLYYCFYHLFVASMVFASVVSNLGLMWVGIELTTLVSALLVALYGKQLALEAAWKYLIMGSVGISFALLGIIFLYISALHLPHQEATALQWPEMMMLADHLKPRWFEIGFVFVLVGFGAKAGLAPMHFWLPDAHSQAPSPVSAVLSGVLLNTALYGLFRVYAIAQTAIDGAAMYLMIFGLVSVAVTVPFLFVQSDFKRMLAYSSVEHMGIITLGVGIGGPLGLFGAMLHMINHAMTKSLLFFSAGAIYQRYHTKQIDRVKGVLKTMPVVGGVFLLAAFAITGAPPFGVFISEFMILMAGFSTGNEIASVLMAALIVLIFAGMMFYVVRMVFGTAPSRVSTAPISRWMTAAMVLPMIAVMVCGLYVPPYIENLVLAASDVLKEVIR